MRKEEVDHLDIEECYRFLHSFKESKLDAVLAKEKVLNLLVKSVVIYDEYALVTLYPSGEQKINLKKSKEEIFFSDAVSLRETTGSPNVN